jgi:hypothetical protein
MPEWYATDASIRTGREGLSLRYARIAARTTSFAERKPGLDSARCNVSERASAGLSKSRERQRRFDAWFVKRSFSASLRGCTSRNAARVNVVLRTMGRRPPGHSIQIGAEDYLVSLIRGILQQRLVRASLSVTDSDARTRHAPGKIRG